MLRRATSRSWRCRGAARAAARPSTRPTSGWSAPRSTGSTGWRAGSFPDHPWRTYLERCALTLKGLTYAPTGALVAAATTSLPETPGGERNWDYRYSWIRDSTFALWGLYSLGFDWEANDFFYFIAEVAGQRGPAGDVRRRRRARPREQELTHLHGYEGARPVRIGNGAYKQRQHDVWGAMLDSVYLHTPLARPSGRGDLADPGQAGGAGHRPLAGARSGHVGGAGRAEALHLVQGHVLGRLRPRRAAGAAARGRRARRSLAGGRRRDQGRRAGARRSTSAASSPSTTTPTRSTRRSCCCRWCASCRPTTSGS